MKLFRTIWNKMTATRFEAGYRFGVKRGKYEGAMTGRTQALEDCLLALQKEHVAAFSQKTLANATKGVKREDLLKLGYEHAIAMVRQVKGD